MKFKKTIAMCRHDEDVPIKFLINNKSTTGYDKNCSSFWKGECRFDNKKCKIVTYERIDK